jgi:hypothetical protein
MSKVMRPIQEIVTTLGGTLLLPDGLDLFHVATSRHPHVLVNIRPYPCLNLIHYALMVRIAHLHRTGFRVTVVFYDGTLRHGKLSETIQSSSDTEKAMDWLYEAFLRYRDINSSQIEFIPESVLWKISSIKDHALPIQCALSHYAQRIIDGDDELTPRDVGHFNDCINGILYETAIKPHLVFFAGAEADLWRQTRDRATLCQASGLLDNEHLPPGIVLFPSLLNCHSEETMTTDESHDPFSSSYSHNGDFDQLPEYYLGQISQLSGLNGKHSTPAETIAAFRKLHYGHE